MYLHVAGPDPAQVQIAKDDCLDLLKNVKTQYEEFKRHGPTYGRSQSGGHGGQGGDYQNRGPPGQRNERNGSGSYGGGYNQNGGGYNQQGYESGASYGYGYQPNTEASQSYGAPAAGSPTAASPQDPNSAAYAAAWEQYYKEHPEAQADPYAAYGGVEGYQQYMTQYYAAQQQQQSSPAPGAAAYGGYAAPGGYSASPGGYAAPGAQEGYQPPAPPSDASAPPPPPPGAAPGSYSAVSYSAVC
jgi:hypothetical protein